MKKYVHGYENKETMRLLDQAKTLEDLLHCDTYFNKKSKVLEAGCGVGAQTKIVASKCPSTHFTAIDISSDSVQQAKELIDSMKLSNVEFLVADINDMPFQDETFDHVLICFVLEHLSDPIKTLLDLKRVLKKDGTMTIIEGDHGSAYFFPESTEARLAIECQIELQKRKGGDANIGRSLYPLLNKSGFRQISVSPRMVYADESLPLMVDGFIKKTFIAMIEGVKQEALMENIIEEKTFNKGITDLYRTAEKGGVFCYTFFKASALK